VLIIFNPVAGGTRRRRLARALRALRGAGAAIELAETTHAGHARLLAADAVARGRRLIVAAGGDGTVAEVAAGMNGGDATLGLLPLGTANVLAHELGVPLGPELAAAVLLGGRQVMLHPGVARWADGSERLFVQMIGAGFDAAVVRALDPAEKRRLGRAAYLLESVRQLRAYGFPRFMVSIDGEPPAFATSVIVSKGRFYGGAFEALPGANVLQPGFSVLQFHAAGPVGAALAGLVLPLGVIHRLPGTSLRRATRVRITGVSVPCQTDGDISPFAPVVIGDACQPQGILMPAVLPAHGQS